MKLFSDPPAKHLKVLRMALHLVALLPLVHLLIGNLTGSFGDDALRTVLWETGDWSLYFLCITLAVTPLRRLTRWNWLVSYRRLPGVYAFFYGVLHCGAYLWLSRSADLLQLFQKILTSKALVTGFVCLMILILLTVTSTRGMFKRLGVKAWQNLHRLTYFAAVLAVIHYWLEVSRYGSTRPLWIGAIVALLLLFRVGWSFYEDYWRLREDRGV